MSIEVSPDLFKKMAGSNLTKNRPEADVEHEGRVNTYKTKVVLNLQGTSLTYFSHESSEVVAQRMAMGYPIYLQTYDGHRVIVNPDQVPAMEVYDVDMFEEIEAGGFDPMVERHGKSTIYYEEDPSWRVRIMERVRELGIEVDE